MSLIVRLFSFILLSMNLVACTPRIVMPLTDEAPVIKEPTISLSSMIEKKEMIVIDAGHGGKDTGTISDKNRYEEKQLTLQTAHLIKNFLKELGYQVVLTRETDQFLSLEKRAQIANTVKANLFISIHYNFCPNPIAEGIEVFYYKEDKNSKAPRPSASRKLGEEVLSRLVKHTGATNRGVKTANFAVIRETEMPAILIEGGFLSNPEEREKLKDPSYRRYLAWGIAKGIDDYLKYQKK